MLIKYIDKEFRDRSLALIAYANLIIEEYQKAGYDLTLRQLYYQFVARDILPNTQKSYVQLGNIVNNGRMAGLISWKAIVDRTRYIREKSHWTHPLQIIQAARQAFFMDRWVGQERRVEVWIEKDALVGVIERVCDDYDVPYFSCRGYVSQSEMWAAAERIIQREDEDGQGTTILHLGDHDPSGIDMTRDIEDRLLTFRCEDYFVKRIALTMKQIRKLKPPPNPAKLTDTRASDYIRSYGRESWELDALEPQYLHDLIKKEIEDLIDWDAWHLVQGQEAIHIQTIDDIMEKIK